MGCCQPPIPHQPENSAPPKYQARNSARPTRQTTAEAIKKARASRAVQPRRSMSTNR
ncbi:MAG: hypothetical protein HC875_09775 [Anaerolineales bacterium]|nr:hypothetical protein [Anaerolineales bacterium]